jgi:hypothetical protein
MFHVEPVAYGQTGQRLVVGLEGGDDELSRDVADLCKQSLKVGFVELCRGVIHKQQGHLGTQLRVASELTQ